MKWMFKEDHALGKGGPGTSAAWQRPRCPQSPVSPSVAVGIPRRSSCLWADSRWRSSPKGGAMPEDGLPEKLENSLGSGNMIAIPASSRPCRRCPLGLGRRQYYYHAITNYEFCSQSTDVSSPQKSEPNTPTVSR